MKFSVLLVYIPALVASMHIDHSAGLEGGKEKPSSQESTRPHIRAATNIGSRSTGMANPPSTRLTKIGSSEPSTEIPRNMKLVSKSQDTTSLPTPSNPAHETSWSRKSAGASKARLRRRHISDTRAFESYLIHKRADKVLAKNLLRTFIDDINPSPGSKPAGPTTPAPSPPDSPPSGPGASSVAAGSKTAQAQVVSSGKPAAVSKSPKSS